MNRVRIYHKRYILRVHYPEGHIWIPDKIGSDRDHSWDNHGNPWLVEIRLDFQDIFCSYSFLSYLFLSC